MEECGIHTRIRVPSVDVPPLIAHFVERCVNRLDKRIGELHRLRGQLPAHLGDVFFDGNRAELDIARRLDLRRGYRPDSSVRPIGGNGIDVLPLVHAFIGERVRGRRFAADRGRIRRRGRRCVAPRPRNLIGDVVASIVERASRQRVARNDQVAETGTGQLDLGDAHGVGRRNRIDRHGGFVRVRPGAYSVTQVLALIRFRDGERFSMGVLIVQLDVGTSQIALFADVPGDGEIVGIDGTVRVVSVRREFFRGHVDRITSAERSGVSGRHVHSTRAVNPVRAAPDDGTDGGHVSHGLTSAARIGRHANPAALPTLSCIRIDEVAPQRQGVSRHAFDNVPFGIRAGVVGIALAPFPRIRDTLSDGRFGRIVPLVRRRLQHGSFGDRTRFAQLNQVYIDRAGSPDLDFARRSLLLARIRNDADAGAGAALRNVEAVATFLNPFPCAVLLLNLPGERHPVL